MTDFRIQNFSVQKVTLSPERKSSICPCILVITWLLKIGKLLWWNSIPIWYKTDDQYSIKNSNKICIFRIFALLSEMQVPFIIIRHLYRVVEKAPKTIVIQAVHFSFSILGLIWPYLYTLQITSIRLSKDLTTIF